MEVMLSLCDNEINGNRNRGDDEEGHPAKDKSNASKEGAASACPVWRREVSVMAKVVWAHTISVR
jgi:hypothetical protein